MKGTGTGIFCSIYDMDSVTSEAKVGMLKI